MGHLRDITSNLEERGAALRLLDLGIDTGKDTGKLILTVFGGIAEFEREIMLERHRKGITKAKAASRKTSHVMSRIGVEQPVMSTVYRVARCPEWVGCCRSLSRLDRLQSPP